MNIYHPYIANDGKHKYYIITNTGKIVKFGAIKYEHYTEGHLDEKRKQRYIMRHKKNENWNNPNTAGYWSYKLLWLYPSLKQAYNEIRKELKAKGYI